ncbi:unnamed protein product [Arabis nemorensis]|uniref:Uncharacterized protein n=1 Tax=Arabis nemorensis TaxID=586526 RepID=A0A565CG88_9BRAS|nr:unnamed protein product [Arabis nemorensis]
MAPSSSSPSVPPASMEYFSSGLILGSGHHHQTHFPIQSNSHPFTHNHNHHHQEFSFVPDHLISPAGSNGGFNLDFNMSTSSGAGAAVASGGFSGFNRGTLQSNSTNHHQSFLTNLQRFPTSENGGGGGAQFLFGALPAENHNPNHSNNNNHQFQLYYENGGCRNSDQKGKGKN